MAEVEKQSETQEELSQDVALEKDLVSPDVYEPALDADPNVVSLDTEYKVLDLGEDNDPVSVDEAFEAVFGYKPSDSPEALSKELFKSNLLAATNTIVQLASFGQNERIRFDAAKYIHESFNGKPGANPGGAQGAWEDWFKEMGIAPPTKDELTEGSQNPGEK